MESNITIPSGESFQGYYWLSDKDNPVVIDGHFDGMELEDQSNPFVIEAQLYDKLSKISYGVKYIDGRYYVNKSPVTADIVNNAKSFVSKWDGNIRLLFSNVWEAEKDPLCCDMEVLMPHNQIFVGFKK